MSVKVGAEGAVVSVLGVVDVGPAGQGGCLVVDEETAVLDGRAFLDFDRVEGVNLSMALRRDVAKPVPRRYTNLLGDIVDAVDCTSTVATCMESVSCTQNF